MIRRLIRTLLRLNPARIAVIGFAAVILAGGVVLTLPVSNAAAPVGFLDALFTATSAVCVTGLAVVDIGTRYTFFGQFVTVALIQMGGFGIVTLGVLILSMMGGRATIALSDAAAGSFLPSSHLTLRQMLWRAAWLTVGFEGAGALILTLWWWREFPFARAAWLGVFHAVSAFCNAGFGLFPDNLVSYAGDWIVNLTVMSLIVLGGIGYFVLFDVGRLLRPRHGVRWHPLSFHTKIVVTLTACLIFGGAAGLYLLEREDNLAGLPFNQQALRALFQSVTARTAGFNTMDIHALSNPSLLWLILLMFIGAGPGSTAGGVKVSTLGVVLIVVFSRLRGRATSAFFGRTVNRGDQERAFALLLLAGTLIVSCTMMLLITELAGRPHVESRGMFLELLFETTSAFGTVGLSTGVTPGLTAAGKLLVIATMFAGRLGPLVLAYALMTRMREAKYRYPEEALLIG